MTKVGRVAVVALFAMSLLAATGHASMPGQSESLPPSGAAKLGKLGLVSFPTSTTSPEAQTHFLRGVAALHSFWYPVALEEFQTATKIDPDFAMGYWGEAMAHNHPLWGDPQETDAARAVLERIRVTPEVSERERGYLDAVQILYGTGDKMSRDQAYALAMETVFRTYPQDLDAALFYALALLGSAGDGPVGMQRRLHAGGIAFKVFQQAPDHPGAAHYVIHAYDDPKYAHLALDAARRYADIAPASPHALHMPSHIFMQLGMWVEAAASNEDAWATSSAWVSQQGLPVSERDYHTLHWLQYAYLQQGRYDEARALLDTMRTSVTQFPKDEPNRSGYGNYILASMAASYLVEAQHWNEADQLLGPPSRTAREALAGQGAAHFARGLADVMQGQVPQSQDSIAALQTISLDQSTARNQFREQLRRVAAIQALEIMAVADAAQGNLEEAMKTMEQAAAIQDAASPLPGPPPLIKPVHELFGELLLRAGRPEAAAEQFERALARHPGRARSLLGTAQAGAAQQGEPRRAAAEWYSKFLQQWRQANPQLTEIQEAQSYLQQARMQE
jgi:tetratricopeptide (TPR) repeat protein